MVLPDRAGLAVQLDRLGTGSSVLEFSGELSARSAGLATDALSKALLDWGRVLVDVSGLQLTWIPAVRLFSSTFTALGGWPRMRLVLFGADPGLAKLLVALKISQTVPLAPDETSARQLLERRPEAVTRQIDLDEEPSSRRRARLFVKTACKDWQLDGISDDATLVASELVDNAVTHARTSCQLHVGLDALGLTIAVRDYEFRGLLAPLVIDATGRRNHGLFCVAAISRALGSQPDRERQVRVGNPTDHRPLNNARPASRK